MAQESSKRKTASKKKPARKTGKSKTTRLKQPGEETEVLRELYRDHRNIDKTLSAYEDQLESYRSGKSFRLQLMYDVMSYLVLNPDQYHHPLEDTFFSLIAIKDIALKEEVDKTTAEHSLLKEAGEAVLDCLADQLRAPTTMKESHIVVRSDKYIKLLRGHMQREEARLFRPGAKLLTQRDWRELNDILHNNPEDPLFNSEAGESYISLGKYLKERVEIGAEKLVEIDYPQLAQFIEGLGVASGSAGDIASVLGHHGKAGWDETIDSYRRLLQADSPKLGSWLSTSVNCSLNGIGHLLDSVTEISEILQKPTATKKVAKASIRSNGTD